MNKQLKNILLFAGAAVAYRFYKLYELGESIIYKPVGVKLIRGATMSKLSVEVKLELLNTTQTTLQMRGVDGKMYVNEILVGSYSSDKFLIRPGLSYVPITFQIDPVTTGVQIVSALAKKQNPQIKILLRKKLPFFTLSETFPINPQIIKSSSN